MTEIDLEIIWLFHQLPTDQKRAFIDLVKALNLEEPVKERSTPECGKNVEE